MPCRCLQSLGLLHLVTSARGDVAQGGYSLQSIAKSGAGKRVKALRKHGWALSLHALGGTWSALPVRAGAHTPSCCCRRCSDKDIASAAKGVFKAWRNKQQHKQQQQQHRQAQPAAANCHKGMRAETAAPEPAAPDEAHVSPSTPAVGTLGSREDAGASLTAAGGEADDGARDVVNPSLDPTAVSHGEPVAAVHKQVPVSESRGGVPDDGYAAKPCTMPAHPVRSVWVKWFDYVLRAALQVTNECVGAASGRADCAASDAWAVQPGS